MKKLVFIVLMTLIISSCSTPRMYYWGSDPLFDNGVSKYEKLAYKNYDKQTPESICELVCLYEDMVNHPGGSRGLVPPGIYAEYGYLLLLPSTAEAFEKHATERQRRIISSTNYASSFPIKGEEMMKKEMELYPESAKFIAPLLKQLTGK